MWWRIQDTVYLSTPISPPSGFTCPATTNLASRLLKGVFESPPQGSWIMHTWDVSQVLNFLANSSSLVKLSTKHLPVKLFA